MLSQKNKFMHWHEQITEYWSLCICGGSASAVMLEWCCEKHLKIKGVKHPSSYVKATGNWRERHIFNMRRKRDWRGPQWEANILTWSRCLCFQYVAEISLHDRGVFVLCWRLTFKQRCPSHNGGISEETCLMGPHLHKPPLIMQRNCRLIEKAWGRLQDSKIPFGFNIRGSGSSNTSSWGFFLV